MQAQFSDEEQVALTLIIGVINSFNRIGVGFHVPPIGAQARRPDGSDPQPDAAASFDPLRPKLVRIAYRMLGSVADAEDIVQDAFIRWLAPIAARCGAAGVSARVVTRLCLDLMKSAGKRREVYPGPWLPEPIVETEDDEIDDVTLPLMMALERLSPLERAAFILHDVFGVGFEEVAEDARPDAAACRQLPAGRAAMCGQSGRASTCRRSAAWKSPRLFSRPRAAAIWRLCKPC